MILFLHKLRTESLPGKN